MFNELDLVIKNLEVFGFFKCESTRGNVTLVFELPSTGLLVVAAPCCLAAFPCHGVSASDVVLLCVSAPLVTSATGLQWPKIEAT